MFVYSEKYYADLKGHIFPIVKYPLLYKRLKEDAKVPQEAFHEPPPATREQLLLVHTDAYLTDLFSLKHTERTYPSELPINKDIVDGFVLNAGGSILASREALLKDGPGVSMNIGGGLHHAFPDHAEGFCYIHDVAVSIRCLKQEGLLERALVVDLDLHQGNGTAFIFERESSVFTFSMHQEHLYPVKQKSDLDIGLEMGTDDQEYLSLLSEALPRILDEHRPEEVFYLAGADPYEHDKLGNLHLTLDGLRSRDRIVYSECRKRKLPVATFLAGGYAVDVADTVSIHYNTCLEMMEHARRT